MSDARLMEAAHLLATVLDEDADADERLAAYVRVLDALAAVSGDPAAAAEDRASARRFLDVQYAMADMDIGQHVSVLSEAASTSPDPEFRAKAKAALRSVAKKLAEQGQDIGRWVLSGTDTKQ